MCGAYEGCKQEKAYTAVEHGESIYLCRRSLRAVAVAAVAVDN